MELLRALAALAERPGPEHERLAGLVGLPSVPDASTWTQVFSFNLYPFASVYLGPEGMLGGDARDRVAGFVRALGGVPPSEPDGVPTLLAMYAELRERGAAGEQRAEHAATTLLHEHLLSWMPLYLARVASLADEPYRSWAVLTSEVLAAETVAHPASSGTAPAGTVDDVPLPAALRDAATFRDPRSEEAVPLPSELLIPARVGAIVTLADLRRASRETKLAMRVGERRYVLEQFMAQSVPVTLRWLADHAVRSTGAAMTEWHAVLPEISCWWQRRALATAALLRELADDAASADVTELSALDPAPG